jgi:hypothetical protein
LLKAKRYEGGQYDDTAKVAGEEELRGLIKGSVLMPHDPSYEEARQIWNAMIDRRPAVIVQCAAADDVSPVIRFARKNGLDSYEGTPAKAKLSKDLFVQGVNFSARKPLRQQSRVISDHRPG